MRLSFLAACGLACPGMLLAQHPARTPVPGSAETLARVRGATVTVEAIQPDGSSTGSGFILTPQGLVATAAHVIRGARSATVKLQSGEVFEVQGVSALDENRDFALIRIAGFDLPTALLGNSDSIEVGQRLFAVGAPLGFEATVSDGLLSGVRLIEGTRVFQISVPVSPGSSGGPVVSEDGRVVGIVVRGVEIEGAQDLNFALPINYLRGQMALAGDRAPTPLMQVAYQRDGLGTSGAGDSGPLAPANPPGSGALSIDSVSSASAVPRVVNESLGVDWTDLDGVQIANEVKPDNGVRVTSVSDFTMARTPTGAGTIESHVTALWWESSDTWLGKVGVWFRDELRTVVRIGTPAGAQVFFQRTAVGSRSDATGYDLRISDDTLVSDSAWSRRVGRVPPGTMPFSALDMAIAALPDSLPPSFYIWLLERNGWPAKLAWARVEFGRHRMVNIPIAKTGTDCAGGHYDTRDVKMEVVDATATLGARTLTYVLLARRPHVDVADTKCLRVPGFDRLK